MDVRLEIGNRGVNVVKLGCVVVKRDEVNPRSLSLGQAHEVVEPVSGDERGMCRCWATHTQAAGDEVGPRCGSFGGTDRRASYVGLVEAKHRLIAFHFKAYEGLRRVHLRGHQWDELYAGGWAQ